LNVGLLVFDDHFNSKKENTVKITIGKSLAKHALVASFLLTFIIAVSGQQENAALRAPALPAACSTLEVPEGHMAAFRVYAIGVQIFKWNGSNWALFAPDAKLFADANYRGKVGTHYGGPTWESSSGSFVIGSKLEECTPDASAAAWLLLEATTKEGPGIFSSTSYIQRVNTTGGAKPDAPGTFIGEEKRIPYTTEYYFYRPTVGNIR
jgi:hypothetical protein